MLDVNNTYQNDGSAPGTHIQTKQTLRRVTRLRDWLFIKVLTLVHALETPFPMFSPTSLRQILRGAVGIEAVLKGLRSFDPLEMADLGLSQGRSRFSVPSVRIHFTTWGGRDGYRGSELQDGIRAVTICSRY